MRLVLFIFIGLVNSSYAGTIYTYKNDTDGSTIITSKKTNDPTLKNTGKQEYDSSSISKPLSEKEYEQEEVRVYKQQYKEWLNKGGQNSGLRPPVKPTKIVHELSFWPILRGQLWVGNGLVKADMIKLPDGYHTNEDCMSNKTYYIQKYGKKLDLDIPEYVKVAKTPRKTYSLVCYSSIEPTEYSLIK